MPRGQHIQYPYSEWEQVCQSCTMYLLHKQKRKLPQSLANAHSELRPDVPCQPPLASRRDPRKPAWDNHQPARLDAYNDGFISTHRSTACDV